MLRAEQENTGIHSPKKLCLFVANGSISPKPGYFPGLFLYIHPSKVPRSLNIMPQFARKGEIRERVFRSGRKYLSIKLGPRNWKPLHVYNYEKAFGPIPPRMIVWSNNKPYNELKIGEIEGLELITQGENRVRLDVYGARARNEDREAKLEELKKELPGIGDLYGMKQKINSYIKTGIPSLEDLREIVELRKKKRSSGLDPNDKAAVKAHRKKTLLAAERSEKGIKAYICPERRQKFIEGTPGARLIHILASGRDKRIKELIDSYGLTYSRFSLEITEYKKGLIDWVAAKKAVKAESKGILTRDQRLKSFLRKFGLTTRGAEKAAKEYVQFGKYTDSEILELLKKSWHNTSGKRKRRKSAVLEAGKTRIRFEFNPASPLSRESQLMEWSRKTFGKKGVTELKRGAVTYV